MQNEIIELIEPTPKLLTKRCRLLSHAITAGLKSITPLFGLGGWYYFDYTIAFFSLLLGFIISSIVRAKLRNSAIPLKQHEYNYTDAAIATWYAAKFLCYKTPTSQTKEIVTE